MMMDHTKADGALADAIWWLKGFCAALPADDRGTPAGLEASLREIRIWLDRLPLGLQRLIGQNEYAFGCVLTEHEFELICEALHPESGDSDRFAARLKLEPISRKFSEERREFLASRDPERPF